MKQTPLDESQVELALTNASAAWAIANALEGWTYHPMFTGGHWTDPQGKSSEERPPYRGHAASLALIGALTGTVFPDVTIDSMIGEVVTVWIESSHTGVTAFVCGKLAKDGAQYSVTGLRNNCTFPERTARRDHKISRHIVVKL